MTWMCDSTHIKPGPSLSMLDIMLGVELLGWDHWDVFRHSSKFLKKECIDIQKF